MEGKRETEEGREPLKKDKWERRIKGGREERELEVMKWVSGESKRKGKVRGQKKPC